MSTRSELKVKIPYKIIIEVSSQPKFAVDPEIKLKSASSFKYADGILHGHSPNGVAIENAFRV